MPAYRNYTDAELMALLKSDDHKAFARLYERYWRRLYVVAANKLNNNFQAQEIVQDIFTDLWKRRLDIKATDRLSVYLAAALKYKIIDFHHKQFRRKKYQQHVMDYVSVSDETTEQYLSFNELQNHLAALVADLPEKCRLIYKLSRDAGYSHKMIAEKLNISEKTVESHLSKAIKKLRAGLSFLLIW